MAFVDKVKYIWEKYYKDYSVNNNEMCVIKDYWEHNIIPNISEINDVEKLSDDECSSLINKLFYKNNDDEYILLVGHQHSGNVPKNIAKQDLKMIRKILLDENINLNELAECTRNDVVIPFIYKKLIIDQDMTTLKMTGIPIKWNKLFDIESSNNFYIDGSKIMEKVYSWIGIKTDTFDEKKYLRVCAMLWWLKEQDEDNSFGDIEQEDTEYKNTAIVYHGAPGTGKTYSIKERVKLACLSDPIKNDYVSLVTNESIKQWTFVQFHSSYDYSDFVEGLRPALLTDEKSPTFVKKDGVFKEFCRRVAEYNMQEYAETEGKKYFDDAKKTNTKKNMEELIINTYLLNKKDYFPKKKFYFIIDEINRADLGKVFGELMYAFERDYRDEEFDTQYMNLPTFCAKNKNATTVEKIDVNKDIFTDGFFVPKNVYIIGSMNDIDRSVETFDFALRRRFQWKEIKANDILKSVLNDMFRRKKEARENAEELSKMIVKMNNVISGEDKSLKVNGSLFGLDVSYHIGPAYFKDYDGTEKSLIRIWNEKVEPAIREYVRGDRRTDDINQFIQNCKSKLNLGIDENLIRIIDELNKELEKKYGIEKSILRYEYFEELSAPEESDFEINWEKSKNRIVSAIGIKKNKEKFDFLYTNGEKDTKEEADFLEFCKTIVKGKFDSIWEEKKED